MVDDIAKKLDVMERNKRQIWIQRPQIRDTQLFSGKKQNFF